MEQSSLSHHVMQRVYVLWFVRKVSTSRIVRLASLGLLMVVASQRVSFIDVLKNFLNVGGEVSGFVRFFAEAYAKTGHMVQAISLVSLAIVMLFAWDMGRVARRLFKSTSTK